MAILGIDEVGRGPLAGPLVVSAVILPDFLIDSRGELLSGPEWILELKDSKKLSAKKRERLSEIILKEAVATGLGFVPAAELDEIGISEALKLATSRAVKLVQRLHTPFSQIVIDGKVNFLKDTALSDFVSVMPKADDLVKEVSAASIIAKVARDHYMYEVAAKYPGYGFEKNVGYGTAEHLKAIRELGICDEHRKCFEPIKSMVGFERSGVGSVAGGAGAGGAGAGVGGAGGGAAAAAGVVVGVDASVVKNTTLVGQKGEDAVCEYLKDLGHKIVARNFKTTRCEIDIVSICEGKLYFTEVKTRGSTDFGGAKAAIDKKKIEKMKLGVEVFQKLRPEYSKFQPLLAVASVNGRDYTVDEWFKI